MSVGPGRFAETTPPLTIVAEDYQGRRGLSTGLFQGFP